MNLSPTSGTPAASSQLNSLGFRINIFVLTTINSAYAPPYANPNTSSPTSNPCRSSFPSSAPSPNASTRPENSTPSVEGAWGGTGYIPIRCSRSMRLRPKALILMRAVVGVLGVGLGMVVRWRAVAGAGPEVGWIAGERGLERVFGGWEIGGIDRIERVERVVAR